VIENGGPTTKIMQILNKNAVVHEKHHKLAGEKSNATCTAIGMWQLHTHRRIIMSFPPVYADLTEVFLNLKASVKDGPEQDGTTTVYAGYDIHKFKTSHVLPFVQQDCNMVSGVDEGAYSMRLVWFKVLKAFDKFVSYDFGPCIVEMTYIDLLEFGEYTETCLCDMVLDAVVAEFTTCLIDDAAARKFHLYAPDGAGAACEQVATLINTAVIDNVAGKNGRDPIDLLVVMGATHDLIPYVRGLYITTPKQRFSYVDNLDAFTENHDVVQDEAKMIDRELQFPATRLRTSVPLLLDRSAQLCENVTVKISLVKESEWARYRITLVDKSEPLTSNAELKIIGLENRVYKVVASKENGFIGKLKCYFASYYVSPDEKIRLQFKRW
jgi:hypothetical protein